MRFDGKLEKWNDERGFGFITPLHGGDPVFAHVSAFRGYGGRPQVGDAVTFEVESDAGGKKRAANVQRPGSRALRHVVTARGGSPGSSASRFPLRSVVAAVVAVGLGAFGYVLFVEQRANRDGRPSAAQDREAAQPVGSSPFRCDGRTYCSQMTSCEEAKFFLRNCPGTKMDGNNDGIPCEQQWCTGPFAR